MRQATIGFIGGGNMARSMVSGLVNSGFNAKKIWICDKSQEKLDAFQQAYGVFGCKDQIELVENCSVIILAVKPQALPSVVEVVGKQIKRQQPLVLSICAGVDMQQLSQWFGEKTAIVRAMPNTPALLQCGASGMYANEHLAEQQKSLTEHIMRASGVAVWVKEEAQMDVVGALSGSGPAYFFLMMEIMSDVAIKLGLNEKQAKLLTTQTAYGAARMALESPDSVEKLRLKVTSKGGITEAAVSTLEKSGIRDMMEQAMLNNVKRGKALSELFSQTPQISNK
jgi:pyrroline-5-carboxylate reductase